MIGPNDYAQVISMRLIEDRTARCRCGRCETAPVFTSMTAYAMKDGSGLAVSQGQRGGACEILGVTSTGTPTEAEEVARKAHEHALVAIQKVHEKARRTPVLRTRHVEINAIDPVEVSRKLDAAGVVACYPFGLPESSTTPPPKSLVDPSTPPVGGGL